MSDPYQYSPYRFQDLAALLATSRSAEFLRAFDSPARGHEDEVQSSLASLFTLRINALGTGERLNDKPVLPEDVAAALSATSLGSASADMIAWMYALPDSSGLSAYGCAFYWRGKFLDTCHPDDRDGPPEIPSAKWRSMRASGERRPQDRPDPDPLKDATEVFRRESANLWALHDKIREWQRGPFTDLDLRLARQFDWPVAEELMWTGWEEVVDYSLVMLLWKTFRNEFTEAEKDAILAWVKVNTAKAWAEFEASAEFSAFSDYSLKDYFCASPCHPDMMLRDDA